MAVLIEGIEMPKSCLNCKFPRACQAINRRIDDEVMAGLFPKDHRHSDCPLIEVPEPHGRLGDLDELKTAFPSGEYVRTESVRATIDHMRTIIPASEEAE